MARFSGRPSRRWLKVSLRGMLLITAGVALYCGGYRYGYENGVRDRPPTFDELIELIVSTVRPTTGEYSQTIPPSLTVIGGQTVHKESDPFAETP